MSENSQEKIYRGGWSESTNPNEHDSHNYRYLVHGFNLSAKTGLAMLNLELGFQSEIPIDLYQNPTKTTDRISISCSLIDQNKNGTWGESGLILETGELPLITSSSDAGTLNHSREFLDRQSSNSQILAPDSLIEETYKDSYNEVVIAGEGSKLVGFFVKVDEKGEFLDPTTSQKMLQYSKYHNLPLIRIEVKDRDYGYKCGFEFEDPHGQRYFGINFGSVRIFCDFEKGSLVLHERTFQQVLVYKNSKKLLMLILLKSLKQFW